MSAPDHETGKYHSIVSPEATTASARRALAARTTANTAPTLVTQGAATRAEPSALVEVEVTVGGTVVVTLWGWSSVSEQWRSIIMTGVTADVALANGDKKSYPVDIGGFDRLYLETKTYAGGASVDAWISVGGPKGWV